MKKPAIPGLNNVPQELASLLAPMKENIEIITGVRRGTSQVATLASTASLSDVINKVNEIISKINQSG